MASMWQEVSVCVFVYSFSLANEMIMNCLDL